MSASPPDKTGFGEYGCVIFRLCWTWLTRWERARAAAPTCPPLQISSQACYRGRGRARDARTSCSRPRWGRSRRCSCRAKISSQTAGTFESGVGSAIAPTACSQVRWRAHPPCSDPAPHARVSRGGLALTNLANDLNCIWETCHSALYRVGKI